MAAIVYDGMDGFEQFTDTAKQVLKGGAIGAATGLASIFITNKIGFLARMHPVVKGLIQLGIVTGAAALLKDKVGEDVATGIGVGGGALVLGVMVGQLVKPLNPVPAVHGLYGYGDAVAPVVEEVGGLYGYGDAVAPVVEEVDGMDGYAESPEVEVEYAGDEEEGVYVEV